MNVYARTKLAAERAAKGDLQTAQEIMEEVKAGVVLYPGLAAETDANQKKAVDDAVTALRSADRTTATATAELSRTVTALTPREQR